MSDPLNIDDLPEGIYVDSAAIANETNKALITVLNEIVKGLQAQTEILVAIDEQYAENNVPLFIREQAAQRLGDILCHLTIGPIIDKLQPE